MVVEAAVLAGMLGLVIYVVTSLLLRSLGQRSPSAPGSAPPGSSLPGTWRVAHYDARGQTHVVLRRISNDHRVLDEHLIASLRTDDPEYDEKFLAAMSTARQRQALFEAEEHGA
jgi:hypothetical protein